MINKTTAPTSLCWREHLARERSNCLEFLDVHEQDARASGYLYVICSLFFACFFRHFHILYLDKNI